MVDLLWRDMPEAQLMQEHEQLQRAARRIAVSAAGPDGWAGREISAWSIQMLRLCSSFVQGLQAIECYPEVWQEMRQAHWPKKAQRRRHHHGR